MIAFLKGEVWEIRQGGLVLGIGGVGYDLEVSLRESESSFLGQHKELWIHTKMKDETLKLYGFEAKAMREAFRVLLSLGGVGPKSAMALLSALTLTKLREAVAHQQPEILAQVPGIGLKTAKKIILELQDKWPMHKGVDESDEVNDKSEKDVLETLERLGFKVRDIQKALVSIPAKNPSSLEERVRELLVYLSKQGNGT